MLGYGTFRPSGHFEFGAVFHSTSLTAPDTLVASVAANGSYWPCAAHFSAGHGAALRSTLHAQLAYTHSNGGPTLANVTAGPSHMNSSIGMFRVPMACGRTDDKSVRRDQ